MAYLSLEKETCFFSGGVSAFPSPGKLKFGHCVCLSLTRGAGSAVVNSISWSKGLLHKPWRWEGVNTHPSTLILLIWVFVGRSLEMYSKLFGTLFSGREDGQGFVFIIIMLTGVGC